MKGPQSLAGTVGYTRTRVKCWISGARRIARFDELSPAQSGPSRKEREVLGIGILGCMSRAPAAPEGGASTPDVRCVSPFPLDRQARLARSSGWPRLGAMATVRCPDRVRGRGRGRRRVIGGSHGPFSTDPPNRIIDAGSRRLGENPAVRCAVRGATWPWARRDVARWLQRRSTAGRGVTGSADSRNAGG